MFGGDDTEFIAPVAPGNWIRFSSNRAELSRSVFQAAARGCGHHGCESQAIVWWAELQAPVLGTSDTDQLPDVDSGHVTCWAVTNT